MISHPAFPVEPWCLRETWLDEGLLGQTESLFALANGHLGWRGNLDEGEPSDVPGCYLNGVYENMPLANAERGFGYPESGETMINVTNGKLIRLLVGDEPFDVRYGTLRWHERVLDLRSGTLDRSAEWESPAGVSVRITSRRLVSFTQRAVAAIRYEVEPVGAPARITVQSELVTNEQLGPDSAPDPRSGTAIDAPLRHELTAARLSRALLMHRTRVSKLRVAAGMDHLLQCPAGTRELTESGHYGARYTVSTLLQPGQRLCLVKFVAYGWSGQRSSSAIRDQVEGALTAVMRTGWDSLLADQRGYLDDFWSRADVEIDGDGEVQQAIRFGLFHVLQASARAEGRAIGAKGLTGPGYDGHAFWDTETYVLPLLTCLLPDAARAVLSWRHSTLDLARNRAIELRLRGAAFPWRTIEGRECSGYWPAGTAAFHVNADIAAAVIRYVEMTGDDDFGAGPGLDLLVETARLWRSIGHYDAGGRFRIDGVTGPDEYSALADNNMYTNLMAQHNLRAAARAAASYPDRAAELHASPAETASWLAAAQAMLLPHDDKLGVHQQAEGFTRHQEWDFHGTTADQYPLLRNFPYFELYRKQVVKQADLVLAMQQRPDAFTAEQKARNFAYYERITVRDSSLSACSQAVVAADVGHLDLAYDYLAETALIDLADLEQNVRDGLHIGALAGAWTALVAGFGGLRCTDGLVSFAPRLPAGLRRIAFAVGVRGRRLRVEVSSGAATYTLTDGTPLDISHHGSPLTLAVASPQSLAISGHPQLPRPAQPPGREPARRVTTPPDG